MSSVTDMLTLSPECFPAGTLILTTQGLKPIEEVGIGDAVLTHKNRWMPVTDVMTSIGDTIVIKGHGHPSLEVTPNHPFWARQSSAKNRQTRRFEEADWIQAAKLDANTFWASPSFDGTDTLSIPEVGGRGAIFCDEFWWMVGKWLADGVVSPKKGGANHINICCSHPEAAEVYDRINFSPSNKFHAGPGEYSWSRTIRKSQTVLITSHNGSGDWLTAQFGKLAHGKRLPAWVLTMPLSWRTSLFEGYLFGDGSYDPRRNEYKFASVSKELALGMRLLALSLGYQCGLTLKAGGNRESIGGIEFIRKDQYWGRFVVSPQVKTSFFEDGLGWFRVKSIEGSRQSIEVHNLSVAEDESYIADGIVVHNCTNHSIAKGKQHKNLSQKRCVETLQ